MNKIYEMKIRKIIGVIILFIFLFGFGFVFIFKNELINTFFSKFIALILFVILVVGAELVWPNKNNKLKN